MRSLFGQVYLNLTYILGVVLHRQPKRGPLGLGGIVLRVLRLRNLERWMVDGNSRFYGVGLQGRQAWDVRFAKQNWGVWCVCVCALGVEECK